MENVFTPLYNLITGGSPKNQLEQFIQRDINIIISSCCSKGVEFVLDDAGIRLIQDSVKKVIKKHKINTVKDGNDYETLMNNVIIVKINYHNLSL